MQIWISDPNLIFWSKFQFEFWSKFRFLIQFSIPDPNFNLTQWHMNRVYILILRSNCILLQKKNCNFKISKFQNFKIFINQIWKILITKFLSNFFFILRKLSKTILDWVRGVSFNIRGRVIKIQNRLEVYTSWHPPLPTHSTSRILFKIKNVLFQGEQKESAFFTETLMQNLIPYIAWSYSNARLAKWTLTF